MNSVIVTGCSWGNTDGVFQCLSQFGIQHALHAGGVNDPISIKDWHDQVFSQQLSDPVQQILLGKSWEQLAGEVFRANWQQEVWGWADYRSTWLLEFWRDFDPNTRFILLHTRPEQAIAQAMAVFDAGNEFAVDNVVASWLAYERELLRFYLRNPERCVLVDSQLANSKPLELVKLINKQWGLKLKDAGKACAFSGNTPAQLLAEFLANEVIKSHQEVQSLCQEISSCLSIPQSAAGSPAGKDKPLLVGAIAGFRGLAYSETITLAEMTALQQETDVHLSQLTTQVDELSQQNESLLLRQRQVQAELEQNFQTLRSLEHQQTVNAALFEQQRGEIEQLHQQRQLNADEISRQQQENELLLLQLHQVQEELEQYFQKLQSLEHQQTANAVLFEQQRGEIEQLHHQRQLNAEDISRQQQENELLLLQLHQVQEELEQYFLKWQALNGEQSHYLQLAEQQQAEIYRLQQEQQVNAQQSDQQRQEHELLLLQLHQVQEQMEQYFLTIQSLENELRVNAELIEHKQAEVQRLQEQQQGNQVLLQQENELLLLQLHQVQEELEQYFLRYQQEQRLHERLTQRMMRLYQRWPGLSVDVDSLTIDSVGSNKAPEIKLIAHGVYHPARVVDEFVFKVRIQKKLPVIIIERSDATNPLLRWPVELAADNTLVIPMVASHEQPGSALLSASDWQLLTTLTHACALALQSGDYQSSNISAEFNADAWQTLLNQFHQTLAADSNCLRYDKVTLKRKKSISGYESLWLQCSNLCFNGKQWPQAEFRLAAADVKPGAFSIHPRLEFPQLPPENNLLENWRADLQDDSGARVEFRFETQSQLLDIDFWNSLSENDKALILALIWQLPTFLADLESQQESLARPWADWQRLAQEMMATIKVRLFGVGTANA